jgi:multidrug efflux pump
VLLVMAGCAAAIAWLYPNMRQELSPLEDRGVILANINAPDGATLDYTDRYARQLEATSASLSRVRPHLRQHRQPHRVAGQRGLPRRRLERAPALHPGHRARDAAQVQPAGRRQRLSVTPPSLGQGFRERPVNFVVQTSDSYENLNRVMRQLMDEIAKNPGFIAPDVDLRLSKPELRIEVDRERAADLGVSVEVPWRAPSRPCWAGRQVTRYKRDAEQYDVIVQTSASGRTTPEDIDRIQCAHQVATP